MIQSIDLYKSFGNICAVNNVSVTIKKGTAFGMLGTNGAGKSTFLRMLAGIFKPDAGSIPGSKRDG